MLIAALFFALGGHWAVLQTNRLILEDHRNIDFVVLTGDFGLYNVKMPDLRNKSGTVKDDGKCARDPREGPGPTVPFAQGRRCAGPIRCDGSIPRSPANGTASETGR